MSKRPPAFIALNQDDALAKYLGKTTAGRQFFLTKPFVPPAADNPGREFLALYLFDTEGTLVEARIEDLGSRDQVDVEQARSLRASMLGSLGAYKPGRILIAPFSVEKFGVQFGFVAHAPKRPTDDWQVSAEPGHYMVFRPPWDSGEYSS